MPLFQKPLGWVQRFLYNVEQGALPFPNLALSIDYDWPLDYRSIAVNLTSIVGTNNTTLYAPDQEHHGIVTHLVTSVSTTFLATDTIRLFLAPPGGGGLSIPICLCTGTAVSEYAFIRSKVDVASGSGGHYNSIPPVYVPPLWTLSGNMTSTAAGLVQTFSGSVWERLKSYPLTTP